MNDKSWIYYFGRAFHCIVMFSLTLALVLMPLALIIVGVVINKPIAIKMSILMSGLILCPIIKPISILTKKDHKII